MADRPIIFSAPMIRALLVGRKTQTRRILKPQPNARTTEVSVCRDVWMGCGPSQTGRGMPQWDAWTKLPFVVGDRLWVRENHQFRGASYNDGTNGDPNWSEDEWFRIWGSGGPGDSWDPEFPSGWSPSMHMGVHDLVGPEHDEGPNVRGFATKVLPSIHMPRWASRLTLMVTDVRVERLNDISEADAIAEGVGAWHQSEAVLGNDRRSGQWVRSSVQAAAQRGELRPTAATNVGAFRMLWNSINGRDAWAANPWVVVVGFSVHATNIDQLAPIAEAAE